MSELHKFLFDGLPVRGVLVRVTDAWTDILARRFSWEEFMLQAWFMTRVSLLPTILVAIPFGVITSVQIGAVANQIGATSFSGAVNGIGVLRQGAPLVTSLLIAGAVVDNGLLLDGLLGGGEVDMDGS